MSTLHPMPQKIVRKTPAGTEIWMLPQKCLFLPIEQTWVIADIHFGKIQHFRKHGIPIPQQAAEYDYQALEKLIALYPTQKIIFLGDIFHSNWNQEWNYLVTLFSQLHQQNIELILTMGNHDLLNQEHYQAAHIQCVDQYQIKDLIFVHEPPAEYLTQLGNESNQAGWLVAGHIHPGYILKGKGKQQMRLPCFAQINHLLILPAFGKTTGLHCPNWPSNTRIWVITESAVVAAQGK